MLGPAYKDHAIPVTANRGVQRRGFIFVRGTPSLELVAGAFGFIELGFEFCKDVVRCAKIAHR